MLEVPKIYTNIIQNHLYKKQNKLVGKTISFRMKKLRRNQKFAIIIYQDYNYKKKMMTLITLNFLCLNKTQLVKFAILKLLLLRTCWFQFANVQAHQSSFIKNV